jgi:hypothetical protein
MHSLATLRLLSLAALLAVTLPANADADLDELVMNHVMARFDQEARVMIRNSGARFVSSAWNRETRTLIAVGEMNTPASPAPMGVALHGNRNALNHDLKSEHVAELCRHPAARLIGGFLEKYDVTIALVYGRKHGRMNPTVVKISHDDLGTCTQAGSQRRNR